MTHISWPLPSFMLTIYFDLVNHRIQNDSSSDDDDAVSSHQRDRSMPDVITQKFLPTYKKSLRLSSDQIVRSFEYSFLYIPVWLRRELSVQEGAVKTHYLIGFPLRWTSQLLFKLSYELHVEKKKSPDLALKVKKCWGKFGSVVENMSRWWSFVGQMFPLLTDHQQLFSKMVYSIIIYLFIKCTFFFCSKKLKEYL